MDMKQFISMTSVNMFGNGYLFCLLVIVSVVASQPPIYPYYLARQEQGNPPPPAPPPAPPADYQPADINSVEIKENAEHAKNEYTIRQGRQVDLIRILNASSYPYAAGNVRYRIEMEVQQPGGSRICIRAIVNVPTEQFLAKSVTYENCLGA